jgi:hypothetical protein
VMHTPVTPTIVAYLLGTTHRNRVGCGTRPKAVRQDYLCLLVHDASLCADYAALLATASASGRADK